jgi:hypothetical protein
LTIDIRRAAVIARESDFLGLAGSAGRRIREVAIVLLGVDPGSSSRSK